MRPVACSTREELVSLADIVEAVGENAEVWVAEHWQDIRDRIHSLWSSTGSNSDG